MEYKEFEAAIVTWGRVRFNQNVAIIKVTQATPDAADITVILTGTLVESVEPIRVKYTEPRAVNKAKYEIEEIVRRDRAGEH
jgi:hypothetical protein